MKAKDAISSVFISIDKEEPLSKLLGKFRTSKRTEAVVKEGKKYFGVVCKRKLLKSRIHIQEEKVKKTAVRPSVLKGDESLKKAAKLMFDSDVHMLPFVKSGIVNGVLYANDLLKNASADFDGVLVSDVSDGKVVAIDQHTGIDSAMKIMRQRKIDRLPLVTKANKLSGIISLSDLIMKYIIFPVGKNKGTSRKDAKFSEGRLKDSAHLPVINDATVDVVAVRPSDKIKKAISLMNKNRISDVVVLDDENKPAGIITVKDLLKFFIYNL